MRNIEKANIVFGSIRQFFNRSLSDEQVYKVAEEIARLSPGGRDQIIANLVNFKNYRTAWQQYTARPVTSYLVTDWDYTFEGGKSLVELERAAQYRQVCLSR